MIPLAQRLYTAAEENDLDTVQTCLKAVTAADVLWVNPRTHKTALITAAAKGHVDIIGAFDSCEHNDVNVSDKFGATALMHAAREGHTGVVIALLAHPRIDVNIQDKDGWTALSWAIENTHSNIVEALLSFTNTDVNVLDKSGVTPLTRALCFQFSGSIASLLLAHTRINVNLQNEDGSTTLMKVCATGAAEAVKLLLAHPSIDVNLQDKYGYTGLMWASHEGHKKCVAALLAHPATNCALQNKYGVVPEDAAKTSEIKNLIRDHVEKVKAMTPSVAADASINSAVEPDSSILGARLYAAVKNNNPDVVFECVRSATAAEVNWINKDEVEGTALICACVRGRTAIAKALIEHPSIDVNLQSQNKRSALTTASFFGYEEIVQMLLAHPLTDLNQHGQNGYTALIGACIAGQTLCASSLIAHPDVNVNSRDKDGCTALMWACRGDRFECIKLLLAHRDIDVHVQAQHGGTALSWSLKPDAEGLIRAYLKTQKTDSPARSGGLFGAIGKLFRRKEPAPPTPPPLKSTPPVPDETTTPPAQFAVPVPAPRVPELVPLPKPLNRMVSTNTAIATPTSLTATVRRQEKSSYSLPVADKDRAPDPAGDAPFEPACHKLASISADSSAAELTAADRAALDAFLQSEANGVLNVVMSKISAHDRALELLVNKRKECPSLFWFYPKQPKLRDWLRDPLKCLLQDSLMMVVVCPVTLRVVRCGPDGVGWEISAPKAWVKKWGPAILFSIYVMQAAVLAGRAVGIPLPHLPDIGVAANALGLHCDPLVSGITDVVNQEQLMKSLSAFTNTTKTVLGEQKGPMQSLCAKMHLQQQQSRSKRSSNTTSTEEITLDPGMPTQVFEDSYKSIHTFLTTGDNARLGKLEDQLRGSMERVMAEDGDVEWVSTEAVEVWRKKHVLMRESHVAPKWSHAPAPRQEIRVSLPVRTPVVASSATEEAPPSTQLTSSWLAVRLRQKGVKEGLIVDCEQKLIVDEEHTEESMFAMLTTDEFNKEYLKSIGITVLGLQQKLLVMHQELVAQYAPAPLTPPTPGSSASFTSEEKVALEKQLQALTSQLNKMEAASCKSGGSPVPGSSGGGVGTSGSGLQQALMQRTDTATSVNPRTGVAYTINELVQKIHAIEGDLGILATDVSVVKENQQFKN